jgi:Ankyrin repeats (3 copies)
MMATRPSRVPRALQAVFLASNRGREVNRPPAEAMKEFKRIGFFQRTVKSITEKKQTLSKGRQSSRGHGLFFRRKAARRESIKSQVTDDNCDDESFSLEASKSSFKSDRHVLQEVTIATSKTTLQEAPPAVSPQDYLDSIMKSRGYSTRRYAALETGYRNKSTPLQLASYDVYLINLVRQDDEETFRAIFQSGISSNPCNARGESLLHACSRKGETEYLRIMLEDAKSTVQVADDYGRTPLHDCLWSAEPSFDKVKLLLDRDVHLMQLADARGALPFSYTRQEHWGLWNQFLDDIKDCYWPETASAHSHEPPLALLKPNSQPVKDPANALPLAIAAMVAGGRLSPEEAMYLRASNKQDNNNNKNKNNTNDNKNDDEDEEDDSDDDDEASDSSFDSDSDSDDDEDEDDDSSSSSSFDEEEMSDLFALCRANKQSQIIC